MVKVDKNLVMGFAIIVILWLIISTQYQNPKEAFDASGTTFVPVGSPRYGLRGDLLRRVNIDKYFLNRNRNIRLNGSGNWMYESNYPAAGCNKIACPAHIDEYDKQDTCWQCAVPDQKIQIPNFYR